MFNKTSLGSVTEGSETLLPTAPQGYSEHCELLAGGGLESQVTEMTLCGEDEGQE